MDKVDNPNIGDIDSPSLIDEGGVESVPSSISEAYGPFYGTPASVSEISSELAGLSAVTGTRPGLIYVSKSSAGITFGIGDSKCGLRRGGSKPLLGKSIGNDGYHSAS
ncbi:MAG: hypothetical protein HC810_05315 [Acaryochloridaceae cyanobacterium RL_2_7]|nr:hypothetical protein [Acaryochloridaceae cyanobacterium RL_2_7]